MYEWWQGKPVIESILSQEECGASLSIGDDHGDNSCTFFCDLKPKHLGRHIEHNESNPVGKGFDMFWHRDRDDRAEAIRDRLRVVLCDIRHVRDQKAYDPEMNFYGIEYLCFPLMLLCREAELWFHFQEIRELLRTILKRTKEQNT